jgi:hypothetical protein
MHRASGANDRILNVRHQLSVYHHVSDSLEAVRGHLVRGNNVANRVNFLEES